jgi:hypothetical protein
MAKTKENFKDLELVCMRFPFETTINIVALL